MKIVWSLPVPGEEWTSARGDVVRAHRLVEALRRAGHEVVVVAASGSLGTRRAVRAYRGRSRGLLPSVVRLTLRDAGRQLLARSHARRVAATIRAHDADLLIETQVHGVDSGWRAARRAGRPLLLDDCAPSGEEAVFGARRLRSTRAQFGRQVRAATALTVSSIALRDAMVREGAPPERVHVVPNGVDLESYGRAGRAAARSRYGLDDEVVLGFVGSFQPWHRVERLVEAAAGLSGDVRLLLAGDGRGRPATLAAAERLGLLSRVVAPGAVPPDEVPALLAACDVGVLPGSNAYGHPMKIVEYAAAGLPIVAPDLPPVRDVVEDGVTGLLFDPEDPGALALALTRLVDDAALRTRMGVAARVRVDSGWTWDARARALLHALHESPPPQAP